MQGKQLVLIVPLLLLCLILGIIWVFYESTPEPGKLTVPVPETKLASENTAELQDVIEESPATVKIEPKTQRLTDDILLRGTITVYDENRVPHQKEDGRFELLQYEKDEQGSYCSTSTSKVTVSKGAWFTRVSPDKQIAIKRLVLGGRNALPEFDSFFPVPKEAFLELEARWSTPTILHVITNDTKIDLSHIELITGLGWEKNRIPHPGAYEASRVVHLSAQSPIPLGTGKGVYRLDREVVYHARSPGYAWGRIEIDFTKGGDFNLFLQPEASLEVAITGCEPQTQPVLRLRLNDERLKDNIPDDLKAKMNEPIPEADKEKLAQHFGCAPPETHKDLFEIVRFDSISKGPPAFEQGISQDGIMTIHSIPPGKYYVSAELGDWCDRKMVLAKSDIEVEAGQQASTSLVLKHASGVESVPLRGTIIMPVEWNLDRFKISLDLRSTHVGNAPDHIVIGNDEMTPVEGRNDAFLWDAGMVEPGDYKVTNDQTSFRMLLQVNPDGLTDAIIVIPPPAKVTIKLVDKESGMDVDVDMIHWNHTAPMFSGGRISMKVVKNESTGLFEFSAPVGQIKISVSSNFHRMADGRHSDTLEILPGDNTHVIEVMSTFGIKIMVKVGDVNLPWNTDWRIAPELVDTNEARPRRQSWFTTRNYQQITLETPGWYRFKMPDIPGYRPVPEQEVLVKPGEYTEHVIQLVRE